MDSKVDKRTFTSTIARFDSELWHFHVVVPKDIVDYFHTQNIKRLVCKINDLITIHCAFMPAGNNTYFINLNKELRKKLVVGEGVEISCEIWEDTSEYGLPMPDEFREVLDTDPEGNEHFHKLTPGKQRSLIYLIGKLKNQDKRITKSLIILNHLNANGGKLDFKALNEAFKMGL